MVFLVWLKFLVCVGIILFAGTKLARYGDAIAEKTGLGGLWIGLVLMALITSMPELVTGVSAAALVRLPDLALGNFLGSCLFNLSILAGLDVILRRPILSQVSRGHILSAGMGILLLGVTCLSIFGGERFSGLALGWVGVPGIVVVMLYLIGARQMFRREQRERLAAAGPEALVYRNVPARAAYLRFALAAVVVIAAGIWLSFVGDEIARVHHWDASFVGSLFVAITTSMPELVVTITAVRMGALDMAVADLLGANMLNVVAITWADIFYTEGPILFQPRSLVSGSHIITALIAMVMSLLVIIGLRFRQRGKPPVIISWYGPLLVGLYIFGAYNLFTSGIGLG